ANYFQHLPYLEDFNKQNGTKLVSVGAIHYEPLSIYCGKSTDFTNVPDKAQIAVPNDTTNEARALQLLQSNGLITIKEGAGLAATKGDIISNPKNIEIIEMEAAQLPRTLADVDFAVINGNYALDAGVMDKVAKVNDKAVSEASDSEGAKTFGNIVAVKAGNETKPEIVALMEVLQSDDIKAFINEKYSGLVVPLF
ncbi:MAG: MetQ/NlpA family ABC transporter substrate-binding protein, partial [Oscillospiraceae bacterium]